MKIKNMSWRHIAGLATFSVLAATLPTVALTNAAWVDHEYDYATVSALQCAGNSDLASRATGRFVAGSLLGNQLDPVVALQGVVTTNDGTDSTATAGATETVVGSNAWTLPITAAVVNNAIVAGASLSLPIGAGTGTGVYTQYAQALDTGVSTGAAGAVTNVGAIDTGAIASSTAPTAGNITLSELPILGGTLGSLADVSLNIGAVASVATLDGCADAWTAGAPVSPQLVRDYRVATLNMALTSPLIAALFANNGAFDAALDGVDTALTNSFGIGLAQGSAEVNISNGALASLVGAITTPLQGLTILGSGFDMGTGSTATTTITVDTTAVRALLTGSITNGPVTINLGTGAVTVNLATLLDPVNGLNNQPPNTQVLTAAHMTQITNYIDQALLQLVANVNAALTAALNAATVSVQLDAHVGVQVLDNVTPTINALNVHVGYTGTILDFANGTQTLSGPTVTTLVGNPLGDALLNPLLAGVTGLIAPLLSTVTTTTRTLVGSEASSPITGLFPALITGLGTDVANLITSLSPMLTALQQILSLRLNVRPDIAPFPDYPVASPQTEEYFVSALQVGIFDRAVTAGRTTLLNLFLATSSVGQNVG